MTTTTTTPQAKYNASELLTKRELVSSQIRSQLEKRAREFRIVLDDVSITHLTFSREYTNAGEAKQVGECEFRHTHTHTHTRAFCSCRSVGAWLCLPLFAPINAAVW